MRFMSMVCRVVERWTSFTNEGGAALLVFVMTAAVLASIGAYATLFTAANQARLGQFSEGRGEARYIAEAGVVIAMERLWRDPNYPDDALCTSAGTHDASTTEYVDINNNGVASADDGDAPVSIKVTNCGAGRLHQVSAQRTF